MGLGVTGPAGLPPGGLIALAGVLGLVLGSFVSALTWRLPRGESVAQGRSRCPSCGTALGPRDLIPVLSWLTARGRCRHCHAPVSPRYPLIEIASGLAFAGVVWRAGGLGWGAGATVAALVLAVILLALAVIDLEHGLLPDTLNIAAAGTALALRGLADGPEALIPALIGAVAGGLGAGLVRALFRLVTGRDGLGLGDVKFLAVAGLLLSPVQWPAFLILAGGIGVGTGVLWRCLGRGTAFPFGPALILALAVAILFPHLGTGSMAGLPV